ncbi:MAG: hypothetical protein RLZZ519_2889 [Bacteroidota bacterium]
MKRVCLIVEGAGNSKADKSRLVEAFSKLLENAGFQRGSKPTIIAAGGRDQALSDFKATLSERQRPGFPILLVDSEDPVAYKDISLDAPVWQHLKNRDKWEKPHGAENNQVVLMVTSMETWIAADHEVLKKQFKSGFNEKKLPSLLNLESRSRKEVLAALEAATKDCGRDRQYAKGEISFKLIAMLNPATLQQHLPHFQRFIAVLKHHLS